MKIACPFCNSLENEVIHTKSINNSKDIKRCRKCLTCSKQFVTHEIHFGIYGTKSLGSSIIKESKLVAEKFNNDILKKEILKILKLKDEDVLKRGHKLFIALMERIIKTDPSSVSDMLKKYKIIPISYEVSKMRQLIGDFLPKNEMGTLLVFLKHFDSWFSDILEVQKAYPDLILIDKDGFKKVRAEIEYKSSNFKQHKHDPMGCDYVICWQHNTKLPIPVIELRTKKIYKANERS